MSGKQPEALIISFSRGGKGSGVTRIERLIMHPTLKEQMLTVFKKRFGCGGAIKDGVIELQGDRRDFLVDALIKEGYQVKRSGG